MVLVANDLRTGTTCFQCHLVCDDETGVETDTELADHLRILLLITGHVLQELLRARTRDRTDIGDHLIAIHTDTVIREQSLSPDIAPAGSFLQDLQVSADGNTIVIADASFWRKSPAIIVYDVTTGEARRVLESHESVAAEDYMIRNGDRNMEFIGGIVALRGGIYGIALGPDWLYYGALSGSGLYRVRLRDLRDSRLPPGQLANRVERYSDKPLSDGMSLDVDGNVYITDIEHSSVFRVNPERELKTLIQSDNVRWADALSFGPEGYLYLADSALSELILQSREHIDTQGPYRIFRFKPGVEGVPGQ